MPVVDAKQLHKAHGTQVVLGSVDVTIRTGERVGVVGRNGAGKSTLARILAGVELPDAGTVARRRGATALYLEQSPRFDGDPTAHEAAAAGLVAWSDAVRRHEAATRALAAGGAGVGGAEVESALVAQAALAEEVERLGGWEQQHRVDAILGHLGIARPEARISTLSGGEQRRVALARLLIARPELAILDEPTNHLDAETVEWLESFLIDEFAGAVLLITHDRYLLDRVAERTLEVADGEVFSYDGGYERYLEQKAERLAHAARTEANRQNFLRRELEWLRRQPKARTTKQKARIDRAQSALAVQGPKAEQAATFELDLVRSGKTILETHGLGVRRGERWLVRGLDLYLTQGERLGVIGPNGCGKTTLLLALLGQLEPAAGEVTLGKNTRIAYFDQLRAELEDDETVFENVVGDQPRIELGGEVVEPRSYLERFGFDGAKQRQPAGSLSGGERARVALAKLLRQSANLVVLDEPTNDLDVATLGALESMLVDLGATALVVTHDRWFLDRVATGILAFEGEGKVVRHPGNYSTYRRLREQAKRVEAAATGTAALTAPRERRPSTAPKQKPLTRDEERELEGLLDRVAEAESEVADLEKLLADPATYTGSEHDVPSLVSRLAAARVRVSRLTARWEELETKALAARPSRC